MSRAGVSGPEAPLPPPRPEGLDAPPAPAQPAVEVEHGVPVPPPRPSDLDGTVPTEDTSPAPPTEAVAPLPPPRPDDLGPSTPSAAPVTAAGSDADCLDRLTKLGVKAEPLPAIANGSCGALRPLRISSLPNDVGIGSPATLVCPAAEALARWSLEVVKGEADRHLGGAPTKIVIGTSYECRTTNRQAGAKLSEHAFANGVDIMGFEFDKHRPITVGFQTPETPEARFQAAVRAQACTYFSTVLGPGTDAAHANHLHLDLRGRNVGYRICQ